MYIGDAMMVDNSQQFSLVDTINRLRLLVMINQYDLFGSRIEQICTRKITYKLAIAIYHWQRTAASERVLYLAHQIIWMAGIKLAIHDVLRTDAQVNQAHSGKRVMAGTHDQYPLF